MVQGLVTTVFSTQDVCKTLNSPIYDDDKRVLSFDIETDNSHGFGLDPNNSRITEISFADCENVVVLSGSEVEMLYSFALVVTAVAENNRIMVGWNNFGFDEPFIAIRMWDHREELSSRGIVFPKTLSEFTRSLPYLTAKYSVAGGYSSPQQIAWTPRVRTNDISFAYGNVARANEVKHSLKPVAVFMGATPVEIDRTRLHDYSTEERNAYSASDSVITLFLFQRGVCNGYIVSGSAADEAQRLLK